MSFPTATPLLAAYGGGSFSRHLAQALTLSAEPGGAQVQVEVRSDDFKVEELLLSSQNIMSVVTVNGVRVTLEDGSWVLVRASSNKPELVVVVESMTSEADMKDLFHKEVKPRLGKHKEVGAYNQEI